MSLILITMLYILSGCCKEDPIPNPCTTPDCDTIPKEVKLELVWQKPLREDGEYMPYNPVLITKDHIVFFYDAVEQEKMLFVNKNDTSISRFYGPNKGNYLFRFYHPIAGIVVNDYKSVFTGYNSGSMKKIASAPDGSQFWANSNLIDDNLYFYDIRNDATGDNSVVKVNIQTGELSYDKVVNDSECPDCEKIIVEAPNFIVTDKNDTILIYSTIFNKGNGNIISEVTAYNSKDKINPIWTSNLYNRNGHKGVTTVYKDGLIILSDSIINIDPYTAHVNWAKKVDSQLTGWAARNNIVIDNKMYVLNQGHFVEINLNNGTIDYLSSQLFFQQSNSDLSYFDGVFYWTAAQGGISWIFGLRSSDHKLVLKMRSPNYGKPPYYNDPNYDWNGLQIDPETRLGYTADGFFAQCFRIPESYE